MLGCPNLRVLCLDDVERVSLSTLSLALLRLGGIRTLDHNFLHEALFLMHKTGLLCDNYIDVSYFFCVCVNVNMMFFGHVPGICKFIYGILSAI